MPSIHLSPRLKAVADCVRSGSTVADIGTDHAYVPAYLVSLGRCEKAFACDIAEGPLENARQTIIESHLEDRISPVLSDGLDSLAPYCASDIIIAGMGGEMAADIISRAPWLRQTGINLILQPMTMQDVLRKYLAENGFEPKSEVYAAEGKRLYVVMVYTFTGAVSAPSLLFLQIGTAALSDDPLSCEYIARRRIKLARMLEGMERSEAEDCDRCDQIRDLISKINKIEEEKHGTNK